MEAILGGAIAANASIVDQSHGRVLLRAGGPRIRDALAKGLAVDLHPHAFGRGDAAMTCVGRIGVQLWQIDDRPIYELAVPRGYCLSFWHWLQSAAAEFGLDLESGCAPATAVGAEGVPGQARRDGGRTL